METASSFQEGKTSNIKSSLQAPLIHDWLEQV